jgi:Predicted nucleotide-binding protein containing TIR-like domain
VSRPPSLFIGSSSESLDYAYALQRVLDRDLFVTVWSIGVFDPSQFTLSSLVQQAEKTDFAALFLTPDDWTQKRDDVFRTPRDNVVFELGLFIGHIGVERVFLISPREPVEVPSDLAGVTPISYRTDRSEDEILNAMSPAATEIRRVVKKMDRRRDAEKKITAIPPSEVLCAIGALGAFAAEHSMELVVREAAAGRYWIEVLDETSLATSVEVDLVDPGAVQAINVLRENLQEDRSVGGS